MGFEGFRVSASQGFRLFGFFGFGAWYCSLDPSQMHSNTSVPSVGEYYGGEGGFVCSHSTQDAHSYPYSLFFFFFGGGGGGGRGGLRLP